MTDWPSAFIVKLEPSSKLNEAVDFFPLAFDVPTSLPSIRTLTFPRLLQLPNLRVALPFDQNDVDIIEVSHPCTSQSSKSFRLHSFPRNTNRRSSSILSRSQPFSFIDPYDVKSAMPSSAQAAVGPKSEIDGFTTFNLLGKNFKMIQLYRSNIFNLPRFRRNNVSSVFFVASG